MNQNEDFFNSILDSVEEETESIVDEEVKQNPNVKAVQTVTHTPKSLSFNKPITTEVEEPKSTERKFITKETVIDKFNILRRRVELTPSVCDVCAFDIAAKHFGDWYKVPESEKDKIKKAVIEHKRVVHPLNQNLIVDESEIPKTWLGQAR
jgi:hypothetical protein